MFILPPTSSYSPVFLYSSTSHPLTFHSLQSSSLSLPLVSESSHPPNSRSSAFRSISSHNLVVNPPIHQSSNLSSLSQLTSKFQTSRQPVPLTFLTQTHTYKKPLENKRYVNLSLIRLLDASFPSPSSPGDAFCFNHATLSCHPRILQPIDIFLLR